LAAAYGAQLVAAEAHVANPDEAFVAGLLHDVGKTILVNHNPDYADLLLKANADNRPHHDAEREAYGFDHADVGGVLMNKWQLADSLVEAVSYHHRLDELEEAPQSTRGLICIIAVADSLAYKLGLSIGELVRPLEAEHHVGCKVLGINQEQIETLAEKLKETYDANYELMGGAG
jgi:HD-like signal output (HDOD) protein